MVFSPLTKRAAQSWLLAICLLIGILLRWDEYLDHASLWWDEAALALNILDRSYLQLIRPLDHNQAAPVLFLWILKVLISISNNSEFAFRAMSLFMGCTLLVLFSLIVRRVLSTPTIWLAALLATFSAPWIRYSTEAKQYILDPTVMVVLLLVADDLWRNKKYAKFVWLGLPAISLWISHPSLFTVAATQLALLIFCYQAKRENLKIVIISSILCGVSFLCNYFLVLQPTAKDDFLHSLWRQEFAPIPDSWENINWYIIALKRSLHATLGLSETGLAAFFIIIGVVGLFLRDKFIAVLVVLPWLLALIASFLNQYPFTQRFLLFTSPNYILCICAGFEFSLVHLVRLLFTKLQFIHYERLKIVFQKINMVY